MLRSPNVFPGMDEQGNGPKRKLKVKADSNNHSDIEFSETFGTNKGSLSKHDWCLRLPLFFRQNPCAALNAAQGLTFVSTS